MSKPKRTHQSNLTRTVLKALDVLEILASAEEPLSPAEVARRSGQSRPTAYRLLTTLQHRNYVTGDGDGHYRLGTRILTLSKRVMDAIDFHQVANPELNELTRISNETTHFAILDETKALYVDKVESPQPVRMHSTIGTRNPLHCTAVGKVMLAFLPADERGELLDRMTLTRRTPNTITGRAALKEHLEQVRSQGFATDDIENEEGIRCVAAPVFNHEGHVLGAISISGPAYRISNSNLKEFSKLVIHATEAVSRKMGYLPNGF